MNFAHRSFVASLALTVTGAAAAGFALATPAHAQRITEAPAMYRGGATCSTKFPGSFLDIGTGACWQCPTTNPQRTVFPVTGAQACERPAHEQFRRAGGPENPSGLLRTDCRSGWFLDIGKGRCYTCSGYNRTAYAVDHARACSRLVPVARSSASRKGVEGCPPEAFRNGLTANCYACPAGHSRNALIADDLTKVNACTAISFSSGPDPTKQKFDAAKNAQSGSRDMLGTTASSLTNHDPNTGGFDLISREAMKALVDGELLYLNGFDAVTWLASAGLAVGLGYTHSYGYVMSKVDGARQCRKTWSNTFTGGVAASVGATFTIILQKGASEGASETNGWQVGASYPPVTGGWGLHWDARTGALSSAYNFGPAVELEVNFSEYAHSWSEIGNVVDCDAMTWGARWWIL
jgi:hypothetical protein